MDFIITVLVVVGMSVFKYAKYRNCTVEELQREDSTDYVPSTSNLYDDIPVGNNLLLIHESGTFEEIVKELGLAR